MMLIEDRVNSKGNIMMASKEGIIEILHKLETAMQTMDTTKEDHHRLKAQKAGIRMSHTGGHHIKRGDPHTGTTQINPSTEGLAKNHNMKVLGQELKSPQLSVTVNSLRNNLVVIMGR